jgi:hypothetical protein
MKRFILVISSTLVVWLLTSGPAIAQHGHGPSGNPGGPAMSDHGQMSDRSHRPNTQSGTTNHEQHVQSKLTVSQRLDQNTHLSTKLQGLFPPGTDLKLASSGFKNLGQFVAAAHVSHNLGIPFDQLKLKMTGISPDSKTSGNSSPVSLGKAIKELKPEADAKAETKKAEQQAKEDIKESEATQKNQASG